MSAEPLIKIHKNTYIKILNDSTLEILYNDFLFMKYKHFPHDSCPKSHLLQQVHNLLNFANI